MLKFVETMVCFREIPDQITLCINLSLCPCKCKGCHSSYLMEDIGYHLNIKALNGLIEQNRGIDCVSFMGGDNDPYQVNQLAMHIRDHYPKLKVAWFSGREKIAPCVSDNLQNFNYIKVGPYLDEYGPLNSKRTNQRMYRVAKDDAGHCFLEDITYKFWEKGVI